MLRTRILELICHEGLKEIVFIVLTGIWLAAKSRQAAARHVISLGAGQSCSFNHGAGTMLHIIKDRTSQMTLWVDRLKQRRNGNMATVVMANKMARIAWATLVKNDELNQAALPGA